MSSENLEIASLLGALKEPVVIDFDAVQKLFQKSDRVFAKLYVNKDYFFLH